MKKKRAFTLLEIMIVIFLIGLIGGIISYSMRGSLEEGKAFKTKQAIMRIKDILELEIAKGSDIDKINNDPVQFFQASGIVKNPKKLMTDGWGATMGVKVETNGDIIVTSPKYSHWKARKTKLRGKDIEEE